MRLADDDIIFTVDGERITLRPTLRAALRLERRYGFDRLVRAIADGNATVLADVIRVGADRPRTFPAFLDRLAASHGLKHGIDAITGPVLAYVMTLAGIDENAAEKTADDTQKTSGKAVSWEDHFTRLYRIGTGWLGWSVRDTLDATPAEIVEAYNGRIELLNAVFGGSSDDTKPKATELTLDEQVNLAFAGIGGRIVQREKPCP